jgi:hypothetical protein
MWKCEQHSAGSEMGPNIGFAKWKILWLQEGEGFLDLLGKYKF